MVNFLGGVGGLPPGVIRPVAVIFFPARYSNSGLESPKWWFWGKMSPPERWGISRRLRLTSFFFFSIYLIISRNNYLNLYEIGWHGLFLFPVAGVQGSPLHGANRLWRCADQSAKRRVLLSADAPLFATANWEVSVRVESFKCREGFLASNS